MNKHKTTAAALIATLGLATSLFAGMETQKAFVGKYPDAKAKLGKCSTCHTKPLPKKEDHELNAYGKDLGEKAVVDAKAAKKEYDFAKVEALDSDGDGVKNADEIKAGTNPGAK